jgi:hypothetical protein
MLKPKLLAIAALVLLAAGSRMAPHLWNLTAVGAVCLFGGAYFKRKWLAFVVPLAALAISDVFLQTFVYPEFSSPGYFQYVCFAAIVPLGMLLEGRTRLLPVAGAAFGAAALFFLLSNFGVWLLGDGSGAAHMYPLTLAGLIACYVEAIPFALNDLCGTLLFTGVLFGGMEFYKSRQAALRLSPGSVKAIG